MPFIDSFIELAKSALLKHTKVNRAATTTDVLALLRYYQENKVNDLNSILPLLKYLLEKKAMPPIPFAKSLEGNNDNDNEFGDLKLKLYMQMIGNGRVLMI